LVLHSERPGSPPAPPLEECRHRHAPRASTAGGQTATSQVQRSHFIQWRLDCQSFCIIDKLLALSNNIHPILSLNSSSMPSCHISRACTMRCLVSNAQSYPNQIQATLEFHENFNPQRNLAKLVPEHKRW
jgi:hypothetical protein